MTTIYKILSFIGLGLTLIPSFLVFKGIIEPATSKTLMFIGTLIWFTSATKWLNKFQEDPTED